MSDKSVSDALFYEADALSNEIDRYGWSEKKGADRGDVLLQVARSLEELIRQIARRAEGGDL